MGIQSHTFLGRSAMKIFLASWFPSNLCLGVKSQQVEEIIACSRFSPTTTQIPTPQPEIPPPHSQIHQNPHTKPQIHGILWLQSGIRNDGSAG
jgi:hypothetical protein